jgi:ribulose-phosphate 3-epimerase
MIGARNVIVEVDGGVTAEIAPALARAGAGALVAGSAIFKDGASAYARNLSAIREAADRA